MTNLRYAQSLIDRLKRFELTTLVFFGILTGGALLFAMLAGEVVEGDTHALDEAILLALRRSGDLGETIGPYWLTHAVQDITSLGGVTVLSLMTLLTTTYLVISRRIRIAIFTACSILGGWLASTALKVIIARPRPDIVPHLVDVRDLSFPSGHAMLSAVTYLTLGALLARTQTTRATRLFMIAAALFLTLMIGLSRIFLGVHYPTDVLGGWCAGATWAVGCALVARSFVSAKPEPQPLHPKMDDSPANG
ncbi:phosphatase PAP2 family protein [Rhizobium lemnae]|uniref:Phosphatase PAP2 family protein n=1 Tax=Rhizobium lemnae TaxID=1214924 RepID=A0ABV8E5V8_9HYPH|nr:phosphatase PAP2 family protein [Rhizobium lemnae]MCJ8507732.1 phosphatase PAP2 family protein [Rhizobium lemnae]